MRAELGRVVVAQAWLVQNYHELVTGFDNRARLGKCKIMSKLKLELSFLTSQVSYRATGTRLAQLMSI